MSTESSPTSSLAERLRNAYTFVSGVFQERVTTSIAAALVGVAVDVVYTLVQRRLKYEALVSQLQGGDLEQAKNRQQHHAHRHHTHHHTNGDDDEEEILNYEIQSEHEINRCEESIRLAHQLGHRGVISVILSRVGTGITSLIQTVATHRPSTTYISLNSALTLDDMCVVMKRRFGLEEEKLPTTFFVFSRLLRGLSSVLGSADEAADDGSGGGGGEDELEAALRWERMVQMIKTAANDAFHRNLAIFKKRRRELRQKRKAQLEQREKDATAAAEEEEQEEEERRKQLLLQRKTSEYIIPSPSQQSKHKHKQPRSTQEQSPEDVDDDDDDVDECDVVALVGESLSFLNTQPMLIFDDADLDEKALMMLASFAHSCNVEGSYLRVVLVAQNPFVFYASPRFSHAVKIISPDPPTAAQISTFIISRCPFLKSTEVADELVAKLAGRNVGIARSVCLQLEELLCTSDKPIQSMDAAEAVDLVYHSQLRRYAFATTRPLHLYSLQSVGDAEVDEQRAGVFRVAMLMLDKLKKKVECSASAAAPASSSSSSSSPAGSPGSGGRVCCPAFVYVNLSFDEVLEVCPLRVWMVLLEKRRNHLPFDVNFDDVRFRAPLYRRAMLEMVGEEGTPKRAAAEKACELLVLKKE